MAEQVAPEGGTFQQKSGGGVSGFAKVGDHQHHEANQKESSEPKSPACEAVHPYIGAIQALEIYRTYSLAHCQI
ncbi:MAG: hypothetical protein ACLUTU_09780 [Blautia faecis]